MDSFTGHKTKQNLFRVIIGVYFHFSTNVDRLTYWLRLIKFAHQYQWKTDWFHHFHRSTTKSGSWIYWVLFCNFSNSILIGWFIELNRIFWNWMPTTGVSEYCIHLFARETYINTSSNLNQQLNEKVKSKFCNKHFL